MRIFYAKMNVCLTGVDRNWLEMKVCLNEIHRTGPKSPNSIYYVNSLEKLQETSLPPKEAFYSKLNEEDILDEDYQHAQNVWTTFEMKTMREYHDLYLESDVLLLADVQNYELDPCWYYTAPGLSYDAMLKTTGVTLELLTDIDMAQMIEKGIRGGVSMIRTRHSQANNKYSVSDYDSSEPS